MDIVFDFSMADRVGSFFYDLSQVDAVQYLQFVSECFSYIFTLAEAFYTRIGFIWIIIAVVFFSVLTRVIFGPILGGRLNLGPDRADKVSSVYYETRKLGKGIYETQETYNYRSGKTKSTLTVSNSKLGRRAKFYS